MTAVWKRLAVAALLCLPLEAADAPRAWESTIVLRTWDEGQPDPIPQFQALGASRPWFPYPIRNSFGKQSAAQSWRTLNLANEYLACSVLPDLGGHLYNCRDKLSGSEMFYANPSVKKAMVGLRGAWAESGVELNFPVGHSLLTTSPVDWGIAGAGDAASVWVGATDRVTGMRWRVEFTLERGVAALRQRVYLENPTPVRHRYYWWTNADVLQLPDTRFVIPTRLIARHGLASIEAWPVNAAGQDRSLPSSYPTGLGLFAHATQEPFLAVYQPSTRTGTLHYADPAEVPGKKIWAWGRDAEREMRNTLSDDGSLAVEIQAGLFANQETYALLEPGGKRSLTEYWMPVRQLDGISQASLAGILFLGRKNGELTAELLPARAMPGARIRISNGAASLLDQRVSLKPEEPLVRTIPSAPGAKLTFQLQDGAGKELMSYTEGEIHAAGPEAFQLGPQPQKDWTALSFERALYNELQGELKFATNDYRKLLEQSPDDVRAHKGLGRIAAIQQRFEEAEAHLTAVVRATAQDAEAHYYLGVALAGRGDDPGARREWALARGDRDFGAAAAVEDAAATARSGDTKGALAALRAAPASTVRALVMEAALARNAEADGAQPAAARAATPAGAAARARALDPTDSAARFEEALQGGADDGLWEHLAADAERVLEIADWYMHWGLYQDAQTLLARSYPNLAEDSMEPGAVPPGTDPLVAYYLGFCRERLKQDSADYFRGGSQMPVRYVFPNRASSRGVLEAAIRANADDAGAHYLLGLWLMNAGMTAEAGRELQTAQRMRPALEEARALLTALKLPVVPPPAGASPPPAPAATPPTPRTNPAKALPRSSAPAEPPVTPGSPRDIAAEALMAAATGDLVRARRLFNPANFPQKKQDEPVRAAYIELELQHLRSMQEQHLCPEVDRLLTVIGGEDKSLPFTFHPFGDLMKGARFQYYLGDAEAACVDEKSARKRFEKVARMRPDAASPDFAYPLLAAARLGKPGADPALLEQSQRDLESETGAARPALLYNRGLLLLLAGRKQEAMACFGRGATDAPPGMVRYLNTLALRTAEHP